MLLPKPSLARQDLRSFRRDLYIKPAPGELWALLNSPAFHLCCGVFLASGVVVIEWRGGGCLDLHTEETLAGVSLSACLS